MVFKIVYLPITILDCVIVICFHLKNSVYHYRYHCYCLSACPEDRATLGSDPSAALGGYTDG